MLLIYTPRISNRIQYTFRLFFREMLGSEIKLTDLPEEYKAHPGAKINYSDQRIEADELFFQSNGLLSQTGIVEQQISVFNFENNKAFFPVSKKSVLPFDLFAAGFYLVTRYEEYLPHISDHYNRFDARESLAFRNGFLNKPLVNIWAQKIKQLVLEKYPGYYFPEKEFSYTPTIDIDNAYAYLEKGFVRNLGGYLKAISKFDLKEVWQRTIVLLGLRKDPFDTYDYQLALQKKYQLKPVYFFLLGDYGLNDKNVNVHSTKFLLLIKSIADYAEVGIHPSYGSNSSTGQLKKEVERLSGIIHRDVVKSRQHFLRLHLPQTYRNLVALDIKEDYTMGYASHVGFRASICTPFYFYDLDMETELPLKIYPFAVMEGTLKDYMQVPAERALSFIGPLIEEVKAVRGHFISLWHNDTMSDRQQWKGWKSVYEQLIEMAVKK